MTTRTATAAAGCTEDELLTRIHRDQDLDARREMIERAMRLVHHIARRFDGKGITHDELVQVGSIGLIKAVDRFDPAREVKFSTFAVPNIAGEIRRHFRDHGWALRVTRSVQENSAAVAKATERLTTKLQRYPSHQEIAAATELTLDQVLEALTGARHYAIDSLDAPLDAGGDAFSRLDLVGDEDRGYLHADARMTAARGLTCLQERERQIIRLRFEADLTQSEIADRLGISQMHVSRLLAQALATVREFLDSEPVNGRAQTAAAG
ncbi:RNA polymerase sigma factor SigF [Paraconexibacter sp. AEG42_29]|uniref:RNA polymerase sigma factor SigF n=1 Tax=Paraconexibacter sp. AEG42_29 TaxID=2997339 RepID=A0AAU7AYT7_9ACTN